MEQVPENNTQQGNRSPMSLGNMLREARERLGLSVMDVAAQIKFAPRQIEALEADDFRHLPEAAFLRGFVRSYAKILNLDMQTLLAAMPQAKTAMAEMIPASVDVPFPVAHSPQRQNLLLLGAALLLAVFVTGFAVWHFTHPKQPKVAQTGTPTETPVVLPVEIQVASAPVSPPQNTIAPSVSAQQKLHPAPKTEQAAVRANRIAPPAVLKKRSADSADQNAPQGTVLHFVFDQESWTEITDKDGKIISSEIHPPGSELTLKKQLPLSLVIGHAKTTHLYEDGEPVDLAPYTHSSSEVARLLLE